MIGKLKISLIPPISRYFNTNLIVGVDYIINHLGCLALHNMEFHHKAKISRLTFLIKRLGTGLAYKLFFQLVNFSELIVSSKFPRAVSKSSSYLIS